MDELLSRAGSQAVSFAIKSSVSLASTYAIKQFTKFLTNVPQKDANRLEKLRRQLETRIDIINNAIGLIKLCVVRGNTNLGSTLSLILDLKDELNGFNIEMDQLALDSAGVNVIGLKENGGKKSAVALMEARMNELIHRIELVIPLINLSMTTSGVSSSMKLPNNVSPSLLLQASNMVIKSNENAAATQYEQDIQVGPLFEVTSFNVFDKSSKIIWKEHITRCNLRIVRYAAHSKDNIDYNYYIELRENFNDGRYHDLKEDQPKKSRYQIHQIVRLFFTVSGKLLNLEERDSPVLVLKLDKNLKRDGNSLSTEDIEWVAFGEYEEVVDDSESEAGEEEAEEEQKKEGTKEIDEGKDANEGCDEEEVYDSAQEDESHGELSKSLSLLEYIIKLTSLQNDDQNSILDVKDERLSLYLNDENPNSIRQTSKDVDNVTDNFKNMSLDKT